MTSWSLLYSQNNLINIHTETHIGINTNPYIYMRQHADHDKAADTVADTQQVRGGCHFIICELIVFINTCFQSSGFCVIVTSQCPSFLLCLAFEFQMVSCFILKWYYGLFSVEYVNLMCKQWKKIFILMWLPLWFCIAVYSVKMYELLNEVSLR